MLLFHEGAIVYEGTIVHEGTIVYEGMIVHEGTLGEKIGTSWLRPFQKVKNP